MGRTLDGEIAAVLFANDAFYAAFATLDFEAMKAAWSSDHQITCAHPGWHALIGHDRVLESWRQVLSSEQGQAPVCAAATAYVLGDCAYVLCHEVMGAAVLQATNVFAREGALWKMVHHQAGPAPMALPEETDEPSARMQ